MLEFTCNNKKRSILEYILPLILYSPENRGRYSRHALSVRAEFWLYKQMLL
jgi:hypothetical protein